MCPRHDENNRYGPPGVKTMEREFPAGHSKVADIWNEYTQYTTGGDGVHGFLSGHANICKRVR